VKVKLLRDLNENERELFENSQLNIEIRKEWTNGYFTLKYSIEYFGQEYHDFSMVVFDKMNFYLGILAYTKGKTLKFFDNAIKIFEYQENALALGNAYIALFNKFNELKQNDLINKLSFYERPLLTSKFIDKLISKDIDFESYIDLILSKEEIKKNVRKSYKSLINWGLASMRFEIINNTNANKNLFNSFRDYHIEIAGRQTRSTFSWDLQFEGILANESFLVLGFLQDQLVSGVYILHSIEQAYYGVAVNNRKLMADNLPIGHAVLYKAIVHAKALGLKKFFLGNVNQTDDNKINGIIKFKKGFTNTIQTRVKMLVEI
jgi:hypothetical protein